MNNEKETNNEKLTVYDGVLSVLYLIIVAIGVFMCIKHGLGGTMGLLAVISACVFGILAVKIAKYKDSLKEHIGELVFIAAMCVFSVIAFWGNLL